MTNLKAMATIATYKAIRSILEPLFFRGCWAEDDAPGVGTGCPHSEQKAPVALVPQ